MLHWNAADIAAEHRHEAFSQVLDASHLPWQLGRPKGRDFRAEVRSLATPALGIVNCRCDPCAGRRDRRSIRAADDGVYGVLFLRAGRERVRQQDQVMDLGTGSMMIWDAAEVIEFEVLESLEKCTLFVSKDRVHALTGSSRLPTGLLATDRGFGALLRDRLAGLDRVLADFGGADLDRLGESLAQDIVLATGRGGTRRTIIAPQAALLSRIKAIIAAGFANPDFGPQEVAAAAGISPRYLHQVFEREDETVAARILRLRLDAIQSDLRDPRFAGVSVTQIGFARGFSSASHLSRAFRVRFGMSPTAWRRENGPH